MTNEQLTNGGFQEKKWLAFLVFLALCLVYAWGGARTFQGADSAEFATVLTNLGIAHPSGYPLFTMLGHLFVRCSPFSAMYSLSLFAAVITVFGLWAMYLCLQRLFQNFLLSIVGILILGFSLYVWKHATHTEAFALLGCFACWQLYCFLRVTEPGASQKDKVLFAYLYVFLAGLSSSHHLTISLTFPLGLMLMLHLFVVKDTRIQARVNVAIRGFLLFVSGFLPYLYLYIRGKHPIPGSWGKLDGWVDVFHHAVRKEFGTFQSGVYKAKIPFLAHTKAYILQLFSMQGSFIAGFSLLFIVFFVALYHARKNQHDWHYKVGMTVFCVWLLTGILLTAQLQMMPSPTGKDIAARFFLLPNFFFFLCCMFGAHFLAQQMGRFKPILLLVLVLGCFPYLPKAWVKATSHRKVFLERYAHSLLTSMPRGAYLLEASNDAICFGVVYLQEVKNLRKDVRFLCPPLLERQWYVKLLRKRWPEFRYRWMPKRISTLSVIAGAMASKKEVFVSTLYNRSLQRYFVWTPQGLAWKAWRGNNKQIPNLQKVTDNLQVYYKNLPSFPYKPDLNAEPWSHQIMERYRFPWDWVRQNSRLRRKGKLQKIADKERKKWLAK